jgi:uncharacterized protein DUF4417
MHPMLPMLPSDNEWGVASLLVEGQATSVVGPVFPWGALARGTRMTGTYHFFVDDYRFSALLRNPKLLADTGCAAAVEPNGTLYDQSPRWAALEATARKRAAARIWQELGIPTFVDLNVPPRFLDVCLLGVPKGWRAFATRGYVARPDDLRAEYAVACEWAGPGREPLFLVVGGGEPIGALCRELPGAIWVPEYRSQVRAGGARTVEPGDAERV